jgi:predicted peptidase
VKASEVGRVSDPPFEHLQRERAGQRPALPQAFAIAALFFFVSVACHAADAAALLEKHTFKNPAGEKLPYRLARPEKISGTPSAPAARFPLVVILHGAGERGDDNEKQIRGIVPAFLTPDVRARHPAFVVAPQCPLDVKWTGINWQQLPLAPQTPEPTYAARLVLELIEKLSTDLPIDRDRVYLVGVSMGGSGTWDLATRHPERFAGAIVLCGGAHAEQGHRVARLPVWCFQGAKDDVVVPDISRNMVAAIKAAGGVPRYTEYPDAGHSIVDLVFRDSTAVDWLFAQRRPSPR